MGHLSTFNEAGSAGMQATAQAVKEKTAAGTGEQKKLWGGRFTGATDPLMEKFNESLPFDKRMWREDLRVCSTPRHHSHIIPSRLTSYKCCLQGQKEDVTRCSAECRERLIVYCCVGEPGVCKGACQDRHHHRGRGLTDSGGLEEGGKRVGGWQIQDSVWG